MMRKRNSFVSVCFAGISCFAVFCCSTQPANAGKGFDAGLPPGRFIAQSDSDLTMERIEANRKIHVFSWKHWSMPYSDGPLICRQHQGNIACFSSNTSGQLNWKMQPETSTSKSLERNYVN